MIRYLSTEKTGTKSTTSSWVSFVAKNLAAPQVAPLQRRSLASSDQTFSVSVGGGSAGAVVASRLSENPEWTVLLLEAGGSESVLSDIPVAAATLQMTSIDWAYQSEPQEASCYGLINRRSRWPRGRVLGGSSVLNYMLYVRGNRRDYDRWEAQGAEGWSWEDVFPYFLKSEDNQDAEFIANGECKLLFPKVITGPGYPVPAQSCT